MLKIIIINLMVLFSSTLYAEENKTIKFGVLSIAEPARIFLLWQDFADYMSKQLDRPVELVVPRGFKKMKQSIEKNEIDFFYINSYVFYRLKQKGKAIGVAQMQNIAGNSMSNSNIIVRKDSGIKTLADLKNIKMAYVSPMGAGGYLAPRALLKASKELDGDNAPTEVFTKNLRSSITGVLLGDYQAATMCGVNYRLLQKKINDGNLTIIDVSENYPENVVGARSNLSHQEIAAFKKSILGMAKKPSGKSVLKGLQQMKINKFLPYDPNIEKQTKHLLKINDFEKK